MNELHRIDVHQGLARFDGIDISQRRAIERDNALAPLPGLCARLERS